MENKTAETKNKTRSWMSCGCWIGAVCAVLVAMATGFLIGWFLARSEQEVKALPKWAQDIDPAITEKFFEEIKAENIKENLRWLTSQPRVAGTPMDRIQAEKLQEVWENQGLDSAGIESYQVLLSYPGNTTHPNTVQIQGAEGEVLYESPYMESVSHNEGDSLDGLVPPFVAYSPAGTVEGTAVYANYGELVDYEFLRNASVSVMGAIVMVRAGWIPLEIKAKYAAEAGAAALLLFPDPHHQARQGQDQVYPDTHWLPPDGARRMLRLHSHPGDLLTPGYPATEFAYRLHKSAVLKSHPQILVHSISYGVAAKIFASMDDATPLMPDKWRDWRRDLPVNFTMRLGGRMKNNRKLKVAVNNRLEMKTTYNVFGIIRGSIEPDRLVLLGNHRDAWGFGAVDPGGGTAIMLELTRILGLLKLQGWRPRRTLIFCSWGAEEYGVIGSTEWVQEKLKILEHKMVAYLNLDLAVTGRDFLDAKASPPLQQMILKASKKIPHPEYDSIYEAWKNYTTSRGQREPRVMALGANSDFVPFTLIAGIPALSIHYSRVQFSFYPTYHTTYDTFQYAEKFIDPGFTYHRMLGMLYGDLLFSLTDSRVLPFDLLQYGRHLQEIYMTATQLVIGQFGMLSWFTTPTGQDILKHLEYCIFNFTLAADQFNKKLEQVDVDDPYQVRHLNDQMMMVERAFIDPLWAQDTDRHYRHVVFSPNKAGVMEWLTCCPGINDALGHPDVKPYLNSEFMPEKGVRIIHKQIAVICHALSTAQDFLVV